MVVRTKVGGRFYVQQAGAADGMPVLFSRRLVTSHRMWEEQLAAMKRLGLHGIAYDVRRHDQSGPLDDMVTVDLLADGVVEMLDAMDIARAHFVGLSLGGLVGQSLAAQYLARVDKLVLADTQARIPDGWDAIRNTRIATARSGGMQAVADGLLGRWFTQDFIKAHPAVITKFRDTIHPGAEFLRRRFFGCILPEAHRAAGPH